MSSGPRYRSDLDGLLSQSVEKLRSRPMTSDNIVDAAKGLVASYSATFPGPYRITVPAGTHLGEHDPGENVTLEQRLKDVQGVTEVKVGKGNGVGIESLAKTEGDGSGRH